MREQDYAVHHGQQVEQQEISKVLRNTYSLLALTSPSAVSWHSLPSRCASATRTCSWC